MEWPHLDIGGQEVRVRIKVEENDPFERQCPPGYGPVDVCQCFIVLLYHVHLQ